MLIYKNKYNIISKWYKFKNININISKIILFQEKKYKFYLF